jgi:hypothetical protein
LEIRVTANSGVQKKAKSSQWVWAVVIVLLFAVGGGLLAWYKYYKKPAGIGTNGESNLKNDPLCEVVKGKQLRCVVELSSENVMGPGHFVNVNQGDDARVPFPDGDLFSGSCLVPGEQADKLRAALKAQEQTNPVNFSSVSYSLDRSFRAGADLPFPRFNNLVLKAGPKTSEVQNITMTAENAWIKIIDVNAFLDVLQNAGIRKTCLDNLVAGHYSVISKALMANKISMDVTDKLGKSIGLSAAATSGQVTVSGGASANADVDQQIKTKTSVPLVYGVSLFSPDVFTQRQAVTQPVVYVPSGNLAVTMTGNGGLGSLPQQTQSADLAKPLTANLQGTEKSECNDGFERTFSTISVTGAVKPTDTQTLDVTLNGNIGGGHYATGTCAFGNVVGKVGHDNGVSVVGTFSGYIRTVVRSEGARELQVYATGLPPESHLELRGPSPDAIPASAPEPQPSGEVLYKFPIPGSGIYVLALNWTSSHSINGAGRLPVNDHAVVRTVVH